MPGKNGLQVAQTIQRYTPLAQIVFTTAHLHYAYDALEVQPLDFLTKPFGPDSLATIIRKYHIRMEQIHSAQKVELFMHQNEPENKVKLLTQSGLVFINPKEVVCLNATLRHTNVYVLDGAVYSVSGTINKVFAALASPNLIRIGRSVCLNIQYIKKIDKKNRICYLTYGAKLLEQQLSQSHLAVLNRINNISI
jgi:DNA-binding LytR/AlgR family response regulator